MASPLCFCILLVTLSNHRNGTLEKARREESIWLTVSEAFVGGPLLALLLGHCLDSGIPEEGHAMLVHGSDMKGNGASVTAE